MRRAPLVGCVLVLVCVVIACASDPKPPAAEPPPAGPGYDDLRVLSRDDCVLLRDHQISIAVETALAPDGGTELLEAGAKMTLEAALRTKEKESTEAWIARCTGKRIPAHDLRCMRQSTTPQAFNACGDLGEETKSDGGVETASESGG
jgi:hypothetical protein